GITQDLMEKGIPENRIILGFLEESNAGWAMI
ncbi:XisI protein, partial [Arthrospira platensis FACHB-439]|nr:XisI protein [Arthrospira platensis FACHB-439]MBD2671622.1 XisI protein [Arthrospira platensis FACHB-439]